MFATAWFVWFHFLAPRLARQSLAGVIAETLGYLLIVWISTAVVTFCIYIVITLADFSALLRASIRSSSVSMWFAPAIILLSVHDPIPYTASLILIVNTTRVLSVRWLPPAHAGMPAFEISRWPVFVGAFTIQACMVALLWGYPLLAAVFCAASTAILTALWISSGASSAKEPPALPQSRFIVALTILFALAMTFGVYSGIGTVTDAGTGSALKPGGGGSPQDLLRRLLHARGSGTETEAKPESATPVKLGPADGSFPGVILHPEVKPYTRLVAPPPLVSGGNRTGFRLAEPLTIPFSGEYWLFRPPFLRPPWSSISERGSPLQLSFLTTDRRPLAMEAFQELDPPIDPACCGKIQVAISSADRSGRVSLELILVNTLSGHGLIQWLGSARVGLPEHQILDFTVPPAPYLHECDGLKVVFRREPYWANRSAKIEIDRFILIPAVRP